mmetsp:Transcript_44962/g.109194  ORF Transcript_44962/g.109194 Transcript_44962/m.109194 type:complete len:203 (-) Transcript_44962:888-1496(-)
MTHHHPHRSSHRRLRPRLPRGSHHCHKWVQHRDMKTSQRYPGGTVTPCHRPHASDDVSSSTVVLTPLPHRTCEGRLVVPTVTVVVAARLVDTTLAEALKDRSFLNVPHGLNQLQHGEMLLLPLKPPLLLLLRHVKMVRGVEHGAMPAIPQHVMYATVMVSYYHLTHAYHAYRPNPPTHVVDVSPVEAVDVDVRHARRGCHSV